MESHHISMNIQDADHGADSQNFRMNISTPKVKSELGQILKTFMSDLT